MAGKIVLPTTVRPLCQIAAEIKADPAYRAVAWKADPYVNALQYMVTIKDGYGADPGYLVIAYALSNLGSAYRGDVAKRVKAELKAHEKGVLPPS